MSKNTISSQITFLYFRDFPRACRFFEEVLQLETAYDPGWARVFRTGTDAFIGAVDVSQGSITVQERGGMLISLTVDDVEGWYERLLPWKLESMSEIKEIADVGLQSFFFKGPEGYDFEIQEFTLPELKELF